MQSIFSHCLWRAIAIILFIAPATVQADFSGPFDPSNWTETLGGTPPGGGAPAEVDTSSAPTSIQLIGGDGACASGPCFVEYTIPAPQDGMVSFDWNYITADLPVFELFVFVNDNNMVQLSSAGGNTQFGSESFSILSGDTFGFRLDCTDCTFGETLVTISQFSFNSTISEDFGDAPDTYGTLTASSGARHTATGPQLGALRDTESDGQATLGADGDDLNGSDDEDGVTLGNFGVGQPVDYSFIAAGLSGTAQVRTWVDLNGNGAFEPSENVFSHILSTDGNTEGAFVLPASTPLGNTYVRTRISSQIGLSAIGAASDGEVEDYLVEVIGVDYGDAPFSYGVASHSDTGPLLGANRDAESGSFFSVDADGDDNGGFNDDDGVQLPRQARFEEGETDVIVVRTDTPGALFSAFFDWNADGDFNDADETVFLNAPLSGSINTFNITAPDSFGGRNSFARFRITSGTAILNNVNGAVGHANDGEVEDYAINLDDDDFIPNTDCSTDTAVVNEFGEGCNNNAVGGASGLFVLMALIGLGCARRRMRRLT